VVVVVVVVVVVAAAAAVVSKTPHYTSSPTSLCPVSVADV